MDTDTDLSPCLHAFETTNPAHTQDYIYAYVYVKWNEPLLIFVLLKICEQLWQNMWHGTLVSCCSHAHTWGHPHSKTQWQNEICRLCNIEMLSLTKYWPRYCYHRHYCKEIYPLHPDICICIETLHECCFRLLPSLFFPSFFFLFLPFLFLFFLFPSSPFLFLFSKTCSTPLKNLPNPAVELEVLNDRLLPNWSSLCYFQYKIDVSKWHRLKPQGFETYMP